MEKLKTKKDYELEFWELVNPTRYLSSGECVAGKVYWVRARRIWNVAICQDRTPDEVSFRGIRDKFDRYFLFDEFHYDDNGVFGTVQPLFELGDSPHFENDSQLMEWLLDKEIEVATTQLDQLRHVPDALKTFDDYTYPFILEENDTALQALIRLREEGFLAQRISP